MQIKYRFFYLFLLVLLSLNLSSQNHWAYHQNNINEFQINTAYNSKYKFELLLPSPYLELGAYGLKLGDALTFGNNTTTIDSDKLFGLLKSENPLHTDIHIPVIGASFYVKGLQINIGETLRSINNLNFNNDLAGLLLKGNVAYLGKTLNLPLNLSSQTYNQINLGIAKEISKINIGFNFKLLNGIKYVSSSNSKIELTTNVDNFNIAIENDLTIKTSGLNINADEVKDIKFSPDFNNFSFSNFGYAFDLGAQLKLTETFDVFLNAQDLGMIKWSDKAKQFTNKKAITIKGFDIKDIIDGKSLNSIEDSLSNGFEFEEESLGNFSANLSPRLNIGGKFQSGNYKASAIFSSTRYPYNIYRTLSINGSVKVLNAMDLGVSSTFTSGGGFYLGSMIGLSLGPVNAFVGSQNILGLSSKSDLSFGNLTLGMSLGFGQR